MTADDQLMDMLYEAYIVSARTGPDGLMLANCAACNVTDDPGTFRWCTSGRDALAVKAVAIDHIRDKHRAAAVLTIDAMRHRMAAEVDESPVRHRLERFRLGIMVLRDQLDGITRNDIVLQPQAAHARVRTLLDTTKMLLVADKLLAQGSPVELRLVRKGAVGVG